MHADLWHDGERALQAKLGQAERMAEFGSRILRPFMPDQHRAFFASLPFMAVGSVDDTGAVWASLLTGPAGFAYSPAPDILRVDAMPIAGDPLGVSLVRGARLGMLGIELPTRRRNRVNGRLTVVDADGFTLHVEQSFGNCPKYIQRRSYDLADHPSDQRAAHAEPFATLTDEARAVIGAADTAFIASSTPPDSTGSAAGPDVSHRGGHPSFLVLDEEDRILLPDYQGNNFFNTFGNLLLNPKIGISIVDFATRDVLQITGTAELLTTGFDPARHPGAQWLCRITPSHGRWLRRIFPIATHLEEVSPYLPA